MPTVLITGGTGLVGNALTQALQAKGHDVIILSREASYAKKATTKLRFAKWDIDQQTIDRDCIEAADFIIHLAGANVGDKRWTRRRKRQIIDSRVKSGELLVKALREIPNHVQAVVSASAIGWYGPDAAAAKPARGFAENDPVADETFLGSTCKLWEQSLQPLAAMNKRLVWLRTGIVLSRQGGALPAFVRPIRLGIAAILGNGKQVISWIHLDDLCRLYITALENSGWKGVYNAVALAPVSNKTLTLTLANIIKGKFFLPVYVPSFLLKWILGEMSVEVLKSATVSCNKVQEAGFIFQFPKIDAALHQIYKT